MINKKGIWKEALLLALVGGLVFWLTNFAISRTTIAAEYRAALSISYVPMLLESLIGGLIIGLWVSFLLLRFYKQIPAKNPVVKAVILSALVLAFVTITIGGPSSYFASSNVSRYFVMGTIFNVIRIMALGLAIGFVHQKLFVSNDPSRLATSPSD